MTDVHPSFPLESRLFFLSDCISEIRRYSFLSPVKQKWNTFIKGKVYGEVKKLIIPIVSLKYLCMYFTVGGGCELAGLGDSHRSMALPRWMVQRWEHRVQSVTIFLGDPLRKKQECRTSQRVPLRMQKGKIDRR